MKTLLAALLLATAPAIALAEEVVVSPDEFRDFADGWTLYFERDGEAFGSEEFRADGRTRWRYVDGSCVRGVWRPRGAQLCFLYETEIEPGPLCWRMLRDEEGLFARLLTGAEAGLEIRISRRDKAPLLCGGPGRST